MHLIYIVVLLLGLFAGLSPDQSYAAEIAETNATTAESAPKTKTLIWSDGTRYVGGVKDGKRWGKGTIFWQDGTRFVGSFSDDLRNGPGTMILPDGTVYSGFFKNDTLVNNQDSDLDREFDKEIDTALDTKLASISDTANNYPSSASTTDSTADLIDASAGPSAMEQDALALANVNPDDATPDKTSRPYALNQDANTSASLTSASLTSAMRSEVQSLVSLWAAAWSDQNVSQYLAYYSNNFDVPGRQNRSQWEALRHKRLTKPKSINVSVEHQSVELVRANVVKIQFNQTYQSELYQDTTNKLLTLQKEGEFWRIIKEQSL